MACITPPLSRQHPPNFNPQVPIHSCPMEPYHHRAQGGGPVGPPTSFYPSMSNRHTLHVLSSPPPRKLPNWTIHRPHPCYRGGKISPCLKKKTSHLLVGCVSECVYVLSLIPSPSGLVAATTCQRSEKKGCALRPTLFGLWLLLLLLLAL
ncbi:hypothetical protein F4859DRAFT_487625 [Xylaria cf. heliscus]|nr:hypothetical protein F4859DRAFT_487625 [Xylaria cf. heliscus]